MNKKTAIPKSKKKSFTKGNAVFILGVLLAIVLVTLAFIYFNGGFTRPYVAVHLTNGDTYFGQLYHFPKLQLGDVYVIQSTVDPNNETQTVLQVLPLGLVTLWNPGKLQLNRSQIIFIAKVGEDSQVMNAIRESKGSSQ